MRKCRNRERARIFQREAARSPLYQRDRSAASFSLPDTFESETGPLEMHRLGLPEDFFDMLLSRAHSCLEKRLILPVRVWRAAVAPPDHNRTILLANGIQRKNARASQDFRVDDVFYEWEFGNFLRSEP